jgi:hypothetical protein
LGTYNLFSIQDVTPDLSRKQIIIKTNFQVDPTSVDLTTVKFFNYDNAKLEIYSLSVDGKNIIIDLKEIPSDNTRYYLKVSKIKDALKRTLACDYDDYIRFYDDVITKVEVISPVSRQTYKSREIEFKIRAIDIVDNLYYKIEVGMDNAFFSTIATIRCSGLNIESEDMEISNFSAENNIIKFTALIERDGQLYVRARAEQTEAIIGDWSEVISFNIYTVSMDSIETTFLEDYLTTDELFEAESLLETEIVDRSEIATNDGLFHIEFNKNIKLPKDYELDENGYIKLGTAIGSRKELK